jgi:N-acetyl sugar amidotransferase
MRTITYCKSCLFPDTKPDLFFNESGFCDACSSAKRKHGHGKDSGVDWGERKGKFDELLGWAKNQNPPYYDCLVPVSGGKDSTWQVYAMKILHGMHPLAVTFDQFDQTPVGRHNLEILKGIGVDHLHFTLNPKLVKKLVLKGFEIVGDPYWVNHVGMFSIPYTVAKRFNIPLVIFGENPQFEYGGPSAMRDNAIMDKRWRQEFGGMRGFREEDMLDTKLGITEKDLAILRFPELSNSGEFQVRGIFYGYYFKWDIAEHLPLVKSLGWTSLAEPSTGSYLDYENCDMRFIDIRENIKYLKYGYGRATDQLNIELRAGRLSRAEALMSVKTIDGQVSEANIEDFCLYLDISCKKYNSIIDSFVNEDIFIKDNCGRWQLRTERF